MFFNEYFVQQKKAAPKKEKENYYLLVQPLNLVQGDVFVTGSLRPRFTAAFPEDRERGKGPGPFGPFLWDLLPRAEGKGEGFLRFFCPGRKLLSGGGGGFLGRGGSLWP